MTGTSNLVGATTIGGTLGVTGATTIGVSGTAATINNLTVNGATTITGNLNVNKAITIPSIIASIGNINLSQNYQSTANATVSEISNDIDTYKALTIVGNSSGPTPTGGIAGRNRNVVIYDNLTIANPTYNGTLTVNGATTLNGTLGVTGNTNINGNLNGGNIYLNNKYTGNSSATNAELSSDTSANYSCLMILGNTANANKTNPNGRRRIGMWDDVTVNGNFNVTGDVTGTLKVTGNILNKAAAFRIKFYFWNIYYLTQKSESPGTNATINTTDDSDYWIECGARLLNLQTNKFLTWDKTTFTLEGINTQKHQMFTKVPGMSDGSFQNTYRYLIEPLNSDKYSPVGDKGQNILQVGRNNWFLGHNGGKIAVQDYNLLLQKMKPLQ